jgi:Zn-dependent protease
MLRATMNPAQILEGLLWFLAFLFSTTVHEAAHALAALWGGDRTAYEGGQVSMSPIPHIRREPIGMLVMPLLTAMTQGWAFGWASAPFDPRWAERHPKRAAWMAAAGPVANFAIAGLAFVALRIGLSAGAFVPVDLDDFSFSRLVVPASGDLNGVVAIVARVLSVLLMLNVILGTLNLLPLPPLDGSSAIGILLPESWAGRWRYTMRSPIFSLLGLLLIWYVLPQLHFFSRLGAIVVRLLYRG